MLLQSVLFATGFSAVICFDLEPWDVNKWWQPDDAVDEDTNCNVCAKLVNSRGRQVAKKCRKGIPNIKEYACIPMGKAYQLKGKLDVHITTDCGDAAWIDRFLVMDSGPGGRPTQKIYGANNEHGWCLSTDKNDYKSWNSDWYKQHVTANACYKTLILDKHSTNVHGRGAGRRRMVEGDDLIAQQTLLPSAPPMMPSNELAEKFYSGTSFGDFEDALEFNPRDFDCRDVNWQKALKRRDLDFGTRLQLRGCARGNSRGPSDFRKPPQRKRYPPNRRAPTQQPIRVRDYPPRTSDRDYPPTISDPPVTGDRDWPRTNRNPTKTIVVTKKASGCSICGIDLAGVADAVSSFFKKMGRRRTDDEVEPETETDMFALSDEEPMIDFDRRRAEEAELVDPEQEMESVFEDVADRLAWTD